MTYETNYGYKVICDELKLLRKLVKESDFSNHPEALKDRRRKIKQLETCLEILEKNGTIY